MSPDRKCPNCGAELASQAFEGLCPGCIVRMMRHPDAARGDGPSSPSSLRPSKLNCFGDYELLEEIARGGMGIVFKARQVSLNRLVALKMILAGKLASPALVQRFHTEAEAAANLKHPNIVAIHEVGEHEGQHYFSMDYIAGQSLAERVRQGPMPLKEAATCIQSIAGAIYYAHQRGVLHRDLKPSNILLDAKDNPHITDFGLAKLVEQESSLTQSEATLGTPSYMSPEQAAGGAKQLTTAADIYSLGAIFYELLTGRPPFHASTALETMRRVMEDEPVPPSRIANHDLRSASPSAERGISRKAQIVNRIDRDSETICLKCLRKDPEARYASAEALAEDLARWQNGEPIHARPVGPAEKLWRWCRRKPVVASLGAAALVLLLAVMIGSPMAIYRINHERQRAEQGELAARRSELVARQKAYASDLNLAQQALSQNNLGRAQELLNRHRPSANQLHSSRREEAHPQLGTRNSELETRQSLFTSATDLRGWEWRYLWQQCQSGALFALGHKSNPIFSLASSFDGKWLAVGEQDEGRLSVWDLQKREEIVEFPTGEGPVFAVFSPRARLLAFSRGVAWPSSNTRHCVGIWDGDTGQTVELPLAGPCRGLAFSGDGQTLVGLSAGSIISPEGGQLTLWKVPDGKKLAHHPAGQIRWQWGTPFAVAPDLSVAAYPLSTDTLRVVDLRTGQERWKARLSNHIVTALAISPDGRILASGSGFGPSPIRLWDLALGNTVDISDNHGGYVSALGFSKDGKTLVSGSSDQMIRWWATEGLRPLRTLLGHRSEVASLAVLPDNEILVSGGKDGSILVWNAGASERARPEIRLPENLIAWSFDTNSRTVLTCDRKGRVGRWQGSYLVEERLFEMGANVAQAAFLSHRSIVLARLRDGTIQVWDLNTRTFSRDLPLALTAPPRWLCMAQGNRLIIGGLASETLHELDITTWRKVRTWRGPAQLHAGALSPEGRVCVTLGYGGASRVTDLITGHTRVTNFEIKDASDATFTADGKLLATATHRGFASIWDAATLQPVADLRGFLQGVYSVAFSPDGQRLVAGSDGKEAIKLWDVESQQELLTLEGEGTMFVPTAFSSDGAVLGSMNGSGILHLWRAPSWTEIEAQEKAGRK
jgi:eukaryotic-like serine/threonine-protein kinase